MNTDEEIEMNVKPWRERAVAAEAKLREAVKLFERIRQFVGQEVNGASFVDLSEVEIAIDKWQREVGNQE